MRAVFCGEKATATHGSGLTGVYDNYNATNNHHHHYSTTSYNSNGQLNTPPDEHAYPFPDMDKTRFVDGGPAAEEDGFNPAAGVAAWLEVWDYVGGASFRGFVADDGEEKSLFAFFDSAVIERDLKQALMALIELADSPLGCSQLVVCIDRSVPAEDARSLMKGLQWAGFSLTTLDFWADGTDVTSKEWAFMGMEI